MDTSCRAVRFGALVVLVGALGHPASSQTDLAGGSPFAAAGRAPDKALPVATLSGFVANRGQWDDEVLFFARQGAIEATLTRDALVLTPRRDPECDGLRPAPLVLR
ncbi:MAG: hypothetical protein H6825_06355, partial [Planctomycetes bacterium]|nr:hypothetical protein [Planctomycetota bacterium]